ncbi:MAG: hypothetical protein ACJ72D_20140 [Marmoricola sp.]
MTEPNKHRHAKPKRAARPERPARPGRGKRVAVPVDPTSTLRDAVSGGGRSARSGSGLPSGLSSGLRWFRTTPGLIVLAVVVLGLAFVIRLAVTGDDDASSASQGDPTAPGAANASYGNQWRSPDGYDYEISVATLNDLVAVGSPSACVATPPSSATTNLHFTVTIKNRSKKDAPVPEVLFGTNLSPTGAVRKSLPSFAKANKDLEITPLAQAKTCADGARLESAQRDKIPKGGSVTFTGTFGPTPIPVARGIVVLVRYFEEDGSKPKGKPVDLLAPFGEFPTTG